MRYYSGVDGGKRAIEPYQVSAAFSNALSGSLYSVLMRI